jgi:hypothetical protein
MTAQQAARGARRARAISARGLPRVLATSAGAGRATCRLSIVPAVARRSSRPHAPPRCQVKLFLFEVVNKGLYPRLNVTL